MLLLFATFGLVAAEGMMGKFECLGCDFDFAGVGFGEERRNGKLSVQQ